MPNKKVGDQRLFSWSANNFIIKEVIDEPDFVLRWTWTSGVCQHCKRKQERIVNHNIYKIEILVDETKKENLLKVSDLVICGHTLDARYMRIPIENYKEILEKSKKYKKFLKDL